LNVKIKRVYERPDKDDGVRILVDRLWPRGLTRQKASVDLWLKQIAPSTELRKWFAHDPAKWKRFRGRYETEIRHKDDLVKVLKQKARAGTITLIYGARNEKHNEALVLKHFLEARGRETPHSRRSGIINLRKTALRQVLQRRGHDY
jgi:uncharacterized protein YeaO (DUF488 family)